MSKLDQIRANAAATRKAKNSRDGVETFLAGVERMIKSKPNPFQDAARGRDTPKTIPPETNSGAPQPRGEPAQTNATQPTGSPNIKRGRPRIGETRDKPWETVGMSERTYYRRQAEKREGGK